MTENARCKLGAVKVVWWGGRRTQWKESVSLKAANCE